MRKKLAFAPASMATPLIAVIFIFVVCSANALYFFSDRGTWPDSWPKELEPLRNQSRTLSHETGNIHEIRFKNREEFESAWPHILAVKSKEAPLILLSSPYHRSGDFIIKAGVSILSPLTARLVIPEGEKAPKTLEDKHELLKEHFKKKPRIDIQLIVDGDIVDLNRIPLPTDTPIIDKRFEQTQNKSDADDGK